MTLVKICGLMHAADVDACCENGVDLLGIIVQYPQPVPWNVTPQRAELLLRRVTGATQSCVVTGGEAERVIALCHVLRPQFVQLQYEESAWEVACIARALRPLGIRVIKAIPLHADGSVAVSGVEDIPQAVQAFAQAGAAALLLDTRCPQSPRMGGGQMDLALYAQAVQHSPVPVWLAGGLHVQNLPQVLQRVQPYGVDILSGAEREMGNKDIDAICTLCTLAHAF